MDKEDFKAFIHETARFCFDQLGDRYPALREKVDLLTSGAIKEEMHRAMGKILKISQAMPADISGLQGFEEKIQLIATLYQEMKGKGKAQVLATHFVHAVQEALAQASKHNKHKPYLLYYRTFSIFSQLKL